MPLKTQIKTPTEEQLRSVASAIKDEILPRWTIKDIENGIKRVTVTEVRYIHEVFVAPGIFVRLCYYHFGDRTRKPFDLNGFTIKQWRNDA